MNNADLQGYYTNFKGQKVLVSGKQINGYYIVVEIVGTKRGELSLKSAFKENSKLSKDSLAFKDVTHYIKE